MRSGVRRAVLTVLAVLGLANAPAQADVVRIGYQKYGALILLKAQGGLEKALAPQHVSVQWIEFPGGPQLLEGLNVGSVDIGVTGETPPIFAQAAGADLRYIAYEPPAPHSEAILVQHDSPIRSVRELKGRKVALNKGSNVHYLLVRALAEAGLSYRDIQPVYLAPADARAAFERGSVAAWAIWDPYQAAAEQQLHARVLRDGASLVDNHQFYLARGAFADTHSAVLSAVIEAVRQVDDAARRDPDAFARRIAPGLGLSEDIVRIAVRRQAFDALPLDTATVAAQQRIADTFTTLRLVPRSLRVADAIWRAPRGASAR